MLSPPRPETFNLSLSPVTDMVTLKSPTLVLEPATEDSHATLKKIGLEVNMKIPVKDAVLFLTMKNSSNTDIRRYKLILNSIYKPLRYELEMRIPINQSITQPIPLINITSENNLFNVTFSSHNSNQSIDRNKRSSLSSSTPIHTQPVFKFVNEKELVVGPRDQKTADLTFCPKVQQAYNGLIKVENLTTGQLVEYEVIGIG